MIIKHLSHSGFLVEDDGRIIIFDPISTLKLAREGKRVYIFVSHSHHDHLNMEVLSPLLGEEDVYFIFSKDAGDNMNESINNLLIMDHYEQQSIHDMEIQSFGTTDLGNSYLVSLNGRSYFHSGDLNWWHWKRMTPEELKVEEEDFKREVGLLKGKSIDYAFVPVDPRLEEHGYLAVNYFIQAIQPKHIIPMHSFGRYDYYRDLEDHIKLQDTKLVNVHHEQEVLIKR